MQDQSKSRPVADSSRRRFLQESAALVGTGVATQLGAPRSAHAAGSDILKIGLVGCGGRGTGAAANALAADPHTVVVALADAFRDQVERSHQLLRKEYGKRIATADRRFSGFDAYEQLLACDVDVVLLAAPPHFRPLHLLACVQAGKHVFAEKPVAVDAPGVHKILAACEEARKQGISIVSGLCYRFDPGVIETMKRVQDGAIGRIIAVQETYNCGPPWFRNRERQPDWTEMEYQMRNWYPFTWLSGDHNVEQHVHSLDKGAWALEQEVPARAWGTGGRQVRSSDAIGQIFDHHCVTYEFASGARMYSHCRRLAGCANEVSDIFLGTDGICDLMKNRIEGRNSWRYQGPKGNRYVAEHEALFRSIRNSEPVNHGAYMAHSTMLAILGRMVTYTGRALTWREALRSKEDLSPERYAWDADPPVLPDEHGNYPIAVPGIT